MFASRGFFGSGVPDLGALIVSRQGQSSTDGIASFTLTTTGTVTRGGIGTIITSSGPATAPSVYGVTSSYWVRTVSVTHSPDSGGGLITDPITSWTQLSSNRLVSVESGSEVTDGYNGRVEFSASNGGAVVCFFDFALLADSVP